MQAGLRLKGEVVTVEADAWHTPADRTCLLGPDALHKAQQLLAWAGANCPGIESMRAEARNRQPLKTKDVVSVCWAL